ncbi:MAG: hypothetical protein HN396_17640 [Gemmatimonadales bacterium]|jgi:hypothetical protein|nr:hypothetical protein [Gemmatimonadales bacterium]
MIEITTHHVEGAPGVRLFAVDEPDHEKGGGAHHVYALVWGDTERADLDSQLPAGADSPFVSPVWGYPGAMMAGQGPIGIFLRFQKGPIKEFGANGLDAESLLAMVMHRLRCFQNGPFACEANERANTAIGQGLYESLRRTRDRVARQVEGRNIK